MKKIKQSERKVIKQEGDSDSDINIDVKLRNQSKVRAVDFVLISLH